MDRERHLKQVLVTGASGFIGSHVMTALAGLDDVELSGLGSSASRETLLSAARHADVIVHLAGVNRPTDDMGFQLVNAELTAALCRVTAETQRHPLILFSSSIQSGNGTPYGNSKLAAENSLEQWSSAGHGAAVVLRLSNVFGKWTRPQYNSAVATFCHAIANDAPYVIADSARTVPLLHVDDVVALITRYLTGALVADRFARVDVGPVRVIALGELEGMLLAFRASRATLQLPDFSDRFIQALYSQYLSYMPTDGFAYSLTTHADQRGSLAEFIKGPAFGQIFVSRTNAGVTRGNHWHHTKTEKFLVVYGEAVIRFRRIGSDAVIEYCASGNDFRVVDIPPGFVHSIENVGAGEMVCVFWASEIFDPSRPDTHFEAVWHA